MSYLEEFFAQGLLAAVPDPVLWAFIGFIAFLALITAWRLPRSTLAQFVFIFVWVLSDYVGGFFNITKMLMLAGTAIFLVMAVIKIGSR